MRMCGHGTIAAVTALIGSAAIGGVQIVVRTASGEYRVSWDDRSPPDVTVELGRPWFGPPAAVHREAAAALRLAERDVTLAAPIRPVSVSRPKLIVPARDPDAVHRARPDLPALWALCRRLDCTGGYVFASHADGSRDHLVARQFPVDAGYPEDPATGVAAAALAAYLAAGLRPAEPAWLRIRIDQGDAMGQPSSLRAAALAGPDGITGSSVTGQAVRTGREHLDLRTVSGHGTLPEPELR
jgi:PhzF family phenazine biosynthesis protein